MINFSVERLSESVKFVVGDALGHVTDCIELYSPEYMLQQAEELEQAAAALRHYAEKMEGD